VSGQVRGFGLRIASEVAIPGAQVCEPGTPDLTIVEGSAQLSKVERELGPYRIGERALMFSMPGVARYRCDGGHRITVERERGSVEEDVAAMLIATAIPACLWMRGEIVLHAATAVLPGYRTGVAFAGRSGSGKSALLAALLDEGARVVGDDAVCIRDHAGTSIAAGLPAAVQPRVTDVRTQRRFVEVPPERQLAGCELGMLVVAEAGITRPTRLHGSDALKAIMGNLHRPRVPRLLGLTPGLLPRLAKLASSLAIYSIHRLNDFTALHLPAAPGSLE
jgi:hypothetical protein